MYEQEPVTNQTREFHRGRGRRDTHVQRIPPGPQTVEPEPVGRRPRVLTPETHFPARRLRRPVHSASTHPPTSPTPPHSHPARNEAQRDHTGHPNTSQTGQPRPDDPRPDDQEHSAALMGPTGRNLRGQPPGPRPNCRMVACQQPASPQPEPRLPHPHGPTPNHPGHHRAWQ